MPPSPRSADCARCSSAGAGWSRPPPAAPPPTVVAARSHGARHPAVVDPAPGAHGLDAGSDNFRSARRGESMCRVDNLRPAPIAANRHDRPSSPYAYLRACTAASISPSLWTRGRRADQPVAIHQDQVRDRADVKVRGRPLLSMPTADPAQSDGRRPGPHHIATGLGRRWRADFALGVL